MPFKYFTGYGHKYATSNDSFNIFLGKKGQRRFRELKTGLEMENGKIPQFNWYVLFIMRHR